MEIDLYGLLSDNQLLLLFVVIGLGYLLGNIRIGEISIGPTTGVLLAGLVFGHYHLAVPADTGTFGFALFIFSVGLQAGPSFFSAFREDGPKYIVLAVIVASLGLGLAWGASILLDFDAGFGAGLLAGGLTSTPTLAGAQDAIRSGLANIPEGTDAETVMSNVTVGYTLTYLIGSMLAILLVRYLPRMLKMNLPAMARSYAKEKGLLARRKSAATSADTLPLVRAYRVLEEGVGKTLEQRRVELGTAAVVLRLRRGQELIHPEQSFELKAGDVVSIIANLAEHQTLREKLGAQEVLDAELLDYSIDAHEVVVINPGGVGKHLTELDLPKTYGCFATQLVRAGVDLPITDEAVLLKGDRLRVVGEGDRLRELAEALGYIEEEVEQTDLVTFSFGIALGILAGLVVFKIAGVSIGLGSAGGLLVTGICMGYLSSINPTFGRVPAAARYLLQELGLMLLMASIGLTAGAGLLDGLASIGPTIVLCAVAVALIPVLVGYVIGRKVLRLNPALLLGALTGAMTSTPALSVVTDAAKSTVPAIGYAGSYTFANVLLTFGGTLMMMI